MWFQVQEEHRAVVQSDEGQVGVAAGDGCVLDRVCRQPPRRTTDAVSWQEDVLLPLPASRRHLSPALCGATNHRHLVPPRQESLQDIPVSILY